MPFALPEYDDVFGDVVYDAVVELARAQSPLLQLVSREKSPGVTSSVVHERGGERLELEGQSLEFGLPMNVEDVRTGNFDALLTGLAGAAEELAKQQVAMLVSALREITDYTGNVVAGEGKFTFDKFYEALDRMEWSLTDDGELAMPQIVVHPETMAEIEQLDFTQEQNEQVEDLKKRKHEELLARRRSRRLS